MGQRVMGIVLAGGHELHKLLIRELTEIPCSYTARIEEAHIQKTGTQSLISDL